MSNKERLVFTQLTTDKQGRARWPFINAALALVQLTAIYLLHECRQLGRRLANLFTVRSGRYRDSTDSGSSRNDVNSTSHVERETRRENEQSR